MSDPLQRAGPGPQALRGVSDSLLHIPHDMGPLSNLPSDCNFSPRVAFSYGILFRASRMYILGYIAVLYTSSIVHDSTIQRGLIDG
jgi:hypothetical protein